MIFDTHAHYDDEAFAGDCDELISNLINQNVEAVVNVGANIEGSRASLLLAQKHSCVYAAIGVHPSEVEELDDAKLTWIGDTAKENAIYNGGKVVAIGEIGLDYYYPDPAIDIQKEYFEKQIEIARDVKLPMIIHSRDAAKDTYDILSAHKAEQLGGIIHCYSYSKEMARDYLDMGFYFGIGGVLTFKNARKLVETVEYLPMDSIVLETDSPYLAPVPKRGERNDSSNIRFVVQKISELKNISEDEVVRITCENAKKVYGINANT